MGIRREEYKRWCAPRCCHSISPSISKPIADTWDSTRTIIHRQASTIIHHHQHVLRLWTYPDAAVPGSGVLGGATLTQLDRESFQISPCDEAGEEQQQHRAAIIRGTGEAGRRTTGRRKQAPIRACFSKPQDPCISPTAIIVRTAAVVDAFRRARCCTTAEGEKDLYLPVSMYYWTNSQADEAVVNDQSASQDRRQRFNIHRHLMPLARCIEPTPRDSNSRPVEVGRTDACQLQVIEENRVVWTPAREIAHFRSNGSDA